MLLFPLSLLSTIRSLRLPHLDYVTADLPVLPDMDSRHTEEGGKRENVGIQLPDEVHMKQ